jgi:hypothetical protein
MVDVRFAPESGQTGDIAECLLCANNDVTRRSKKPRHSPNGLYGTLAGITLA